MGNKSTNDTTYKTVPVNSEVYPRNKVNNILNCNINIFVYLIGWLEIKFKWYIAILWATVICQNLIKSRNPEIWVNRRILGLMET